MSESMDPITSNDTTQGHGWTKLVTYYDVDLEEKKTESGSLLFYL